MLIRWLTFLLLSLSASFSLFAQQHYFDRIYQTDTIELRFGWTDTKQDYALEFNLLRTEFLAPFKSVRGYRYANLAQRQYTQMLTWMQENPDAAKFVNLDVFQQQIRIQPKPLADAQSELEQTQQAQIINELLSVQEQEKKAYLAENYLREFTDEQGQTMIYPDHLRYIEDSQDALAPIIQDLQNAIGSANPRDVLAYLLTWIQTIPYDRLEQRLTSNGNGYVNPLDLLLNNRGDCDSKVTLAAALLQNLLPQRRTAIVYIEDHALLGIQMNSTANEQSITLQGNEYVLADPTGPALLPLGTLSPTSRYAINNKQFSYRVNPPE